MKVETVFAVYLRAIFDEGVGDKRNPYSGLRFVPAGEPLAHAATPPTLKPACGATTQFVVPGLPWSEPVRGEFRRCPQCVAIHPL